MNLDLSGKRALVCGSTSGIGKAAAIELAALGASVTLVARDAGKLREAVAALPRSGAQAHDTIAADFSKPAEAVKAVVAVADAARPWLILVNNTGGPPPGPALSATPEHLHAALDAMLVSAQLLTQALTPGMKAAKFG